MEKIAFRTGLGDDTAVVPAIQSGDEANVGIEAARFEFAATCYPCIEEVLAKAGVKPQQVRFVITNSSLFNPTPSLSAMVMNHFKMGSSTKGYSLGEAAGGRDAGAWRCCAAAACGGVRRTQPAPHRSMGPRAADGLAGCCAASCHAQAAWAAALA